MTEEQTIQEIKEQLEIVSREFEKLKQQLTFLTEGKFTEEEKQFLKSLPVDFNWIARDTDDEIYAFREKPHKDDDGYWEMVEYGETFAIGFFDFKSIKSDDDEPCEFRKFLD